MDKKLLCISHEPEKFTFKKNPKVRLLIRNYGYVYVELFPAEAPKTVEHFLKLVNKGFYNGMTIHRVVKGHLVQMGDPTGTGLGGSKEKVEGEFLINGFVNRVSHLPGTVALCRTEDYNSGSSQFFINLVNNSKKFNGKYAVFGYIEDKKSLSFFKKVSKSKHILNDKEKPAVEYIIDLIEEVPYNAERLAQKLEKKQIKEDKKKIKKHNSLDAQLELAALKEEKRQRKLQEQQEAARRKEEAEREKELERLEREEAERMYKESIELANKDKK